MEQATFEERRKHLKKLSDEEIQNRFWELTSQVVEPMMDLAKRHTTPSIERSVLLRMGFSSLEASALTNGALDHGLISKGVGHLVYRFARENSCDIRQAGLMMIDGQGWDRLKEIFKAEGSS